MDNNKKENTKIIVSDEIKGNYYFYLNNTIYLSKAQNCESKEAVVICHECIHAMQSKILHVLNLIFSNIELILFFAIVLMKIFKYENIVLIGAYLVIAFLAISIRSALEIPAMIYSFDFAKKYVPQLSDELEKAKKSIKYMLPLGILKFAGLKLIRVLIILLCI
ncbi:MAG: hypothetical protein IKV94_02095 [Clostridia bacterium]|nr:hypothetical protein [Clostridia bacterium]